MCQICPNRQVIPVLASSSISSPLDFQTEGLGFESLQVIFLYFCFAFENEIEKIYDLCS